MASSTVQNVDLVLRARDLANQPVEVLVQAVRALNEALVSNAKAAKDGTVPLDVLRESYRDLERAEKALRTTSRDLDRALSTESALEDAKRKAAEAAAAYDQLAASLANADKVTKRQQNSLDTAARRRDGANSRVTSISAELERQKQVLAQSGLDTTSLSRAQEQLAGSMREVGSVADNVAVSLNGYSRAAAAAKQASQAQALAARDAAQAKDAESAAVARTVAASNAAQVRRTPIQFDTGAAQRTQYVQFWTSALDQMEAKEKAAIQTTNAAITKFRALADQIDATARGYNTFSTVSVRAVQTTQSLASQVQALIDPAKTAISSLDGLEKAVQGYANETQQAAGPVKNYQDRLSALVDAQKEVARQSGLVDRFREQATVVNASWREYAQARQKLGELTAQIRNATAPSQELAAAAQQQARAVAAARRELESEIAVAQSARGALAQAGISTRALAADQDRLRASAQSATATLGELRNQFQLRGGSVEGKGLFGLTPYALTNLSYQVNDIVTQLASGTSLTQTLAQQGGQIFQLFQGVEGFVAGLVRYLPIAAAAAATLAVSWAAVTRARETSNSTRDFERSLAADADGSRYQAQALTEMARAAERAGSSFAAARASVAAFVREGVDQDKIPQLLTLVRNFSRVAGVDAAEATKLLTEGLTRNFEGVVKLNAQFNLFSAAQMEHIRLSFEQKGAEEGVAEATRLASERLDDAARKAQGGWSKAFRELRITWNEFLDALANSGPVQAAGRLLDWMGERAAGLIRRMREFVAMDLENGVTTSRILQRGSPDDIANQQRLVEEAEKRLRDRDAGQNRTAYRPRLVQELETARKALERSQEAAEGYAQALRDIPTAPGAAPAAGAPSGPSERQTAVNQAVVRDAERALNISRNQTRETREKTLWQEAFNEATERGADAEAARTAANIRLEAQRQQWRDEDFRTNQRREIILSRGEQQRVQAAGEAERQRARTAQISEQATEAAVTAAMQAEREKIAREKAEANRGRSAANAVLTQERELQNQLNAIRAKADRTDKTNLEARIRAIDEEYAKLFANMDRFAQRGGTSVGGQSLAEVRAQVTAQMEILKQQETMKYFEETLNALAKERADRLATIREQVQAQQITAEEGFRRSLEVTAELAPRMRQIAQDAQKFAAGLAATPQTQAFQARTGRAETEADTGVRATARTALADQEKRVNDILQERNTLVAAQAALVETNTITQTEAAERVRMAYAQSNGPLTEAINELERMALVAQNSGALTQQQFQLMTASVERYRSSLTYVSPMMQTLKAGFTSGALQGGQQLFRDIAQNIGDAAKNTQSWGAAMSGVGSAMQSFFAGLLQKIAEAIIQMLILRAVSAFLGDSSGQSVAPAASMVKSSVLSGTGAVKHSGGIVRGTNGWTRQVDPAMFVDAPRYHTGATGVGMRPDEVAAVLQKGEEVLSRDDPRNLLNGGAAAGGGGTNLKQVLVFDPDEIAQSMNGSAGEKVIVSTIRRNKQTLKEMLR